MTPLPVPTSTQRASAGRGELEDEFDQTFGFGPGDERAGIAEEFAPVEFHRAEQVLERHALGALS